MRPSSIFAASLFALARARIDGIGVPSTIKPGEPFDLIFLNEIYIQRVTDVAMAVGYYAGADSNHLGSSLGTFVTAFDLGKQPLPLVLLIFLSHRVFFAKLITFPST